MDEGDDENHNFYTRAYKDHLNIDMTCKWTAPGWGADLDTKFNTALAANDLPDVIKVYTSLATRAIEAGRVMTITDDMWNNWLSDYVKGVYARDPVAKQAWTFNGELKGLSSNVRSLGPSRKFWWVRQDWLEETGSSMPKNFNEVIDLARTFMAKKPAEAADTMYGISEDKKLTTFTGALPVFGVSDANWYLGSDGKLTFKLISPGVKDAIKFFANLYKEGIIPEDFSLLDPDVEVQADRMNGKFGIWLGGTNDVATPKFTDFYAMNPEKHMVLPAVLTDFNGKLPFLTVSTSYGDVLLISADCKNPDAVFKIMNLDSDIISAYNKPDWIKDREFDVSPKGGFNFWQRVSGISDPMDSDPRPVADAFDAKDRGRLKTLDQQVTYDQMMDWYQNGIKSPKWTENIYRYLLGVNGGTGVINWNLNMEAKDFDFSPWWSGDTPAMQENGNAWSTKFTEIVTNGIMNDTAEDSYNEFVKYFYDNGGQKAIDEANEWYAAHK